jgi:quinolinate synthase
MRNEIKGLVADKAVLAARVKELEDEVEFWKAENNETLTYKLRMKELEEALRALVERNNDGCGFPTQLWDKARAALQGNSR